MTKQEPDAEHYALADYLLSWLRRRNRGELDEAISAMRVSDFEDMRGELAMILQHGGKPPNWV